MEAVKQGSATVGLKSKTHAVIVALKVKIIAIFNPFTTFIFISWYATVCIYTSLHIIPVAQLRTYF